MDGHENTWVFQFFFCSTDCNTNIGYREDVQFNRYTVKAYYSGSDFALLLLNQTPAPNSDIFYAGWNKSPDPSVAITTLLQHPKEDVMEISKDYDPPQKIRLQNGMDCWRLTLEWGGVQGGSSGGSFFDDAHRIIGQVFGVKTEHADDPCYPECLEAFRGIMGWAGGGTSGTRLSDWLDQSNSGAVTTNTTNVSQLSLSLLLCKFPELIFSSLELKLILL